MVLIFKSSALMVLGSWIDVRKYLYTMVHDSLRVYLFCWGLINSWVFSCTAKEFCPNRITDLWGKMEDNKNYHHLIIYKSQTTSNFPNHKSGWERGDGREKRVQVYQNWLLTFWSCSMYTNYDKFFFLASNTNLSRFNPKIVLGFFFTFAQTNS